MRDVLTIMRCSLTAAVAVLVVSCYITLCFSCTRSCIRASFWCDSTYGCITVWPL